MGRASNDPTDYIAIGRQPGRNQPATTFTFIKHLENSGFDVEPDMESHREGGDGQEIGLVHRKAVKTDGAIHVYARPDVTGVLCGGAFGADTVTIVATQGGILADHDFHPVASQPYFEVEQRWGDVNVERTTNNVFNQLEFDYTAGMPIKISAPFMCGGTYRVPSGPQTPVREEAEPFFWPNASVTVIGATNAEVTKAKQTLKRNLDGGIITNGLNRSDLVSLSRDYDVDLTIKYEDPELYAKAHRSGGTHIPVNPADLGKLGLDIFAAQGSYHFRLVNPDMPIVSAKVAAFDPDGKTLYIDAGCIGKRGATHAMWARVRTGATAPYA